MILADYHVHSDFSSDCNAPMETMIEQAISMGMKKLCFTDHMDYDYPPVSNLNFEFDIEAYMDKLSLMKQKYQSKIEILTGIELGLQPHITDRMTALTDRYPFDFIIGSSHVVDHFDPFYPQFWINKTEEEGITEYFQSIIDNCNQYQGFHIYGHIDYIVRYAPSTKKKYLTYPYEKYADILDEVLKTILLHEKGIEVNTAGYKYGLGHPHPKTEVLVRYKELGGEIITIGSDAHRPEHLGYDFLKTAELLKSIGFKYYTTFKDGKPIFEKL
ncbi:histidinol-phosphatase HisJ family protein [Mobilitalea sibirica]|uniref:Histidinol-phosphatase n=1 Tax=Mobilitalea sibirica TaxID=1462919 RepID=A0A8J7HCR6_9FIRM|nr:histidinol-phosphatase HisJ family protein [Mobilitalea sibirica]MBH1940144.1 histidinol-phosphatase HisJ family protein [Mobilitalea sibirica]